LPPEPNPLKTTQPPQITFLAVFRLLDFGSEYDAQLRAAAGRDCRETMQFGALGLHLGEWVVGACWLGVVGAVGIGGWIAIAVRLCSCSSCRLAKRELGA